MNVEIVRISAITTVATEVVEVEMLCFLLIIIKQMYAIFYNKKTK